MEIKKNIYVGGDWEQLISKIPDFFFFFWFNGNRDTLIKVYRKIF